MIHCSTATGKLLFADLPVALGPQSVAADVLSCYCRLRCASVCLLLPIRTHHDTITTGGTGDATCHGKHSDCMTEKKCASISFAGILTPTGKQDK